VKLTVLSIFTEKTLLIAAVVFVFLFYVFGIMVAFRVEVWIDFQTTKSESEPPEKPVYSALVTLQNKRKKKKMRSLSL
jgi:ABC-type protease/lipase transport system fused ATPase/permease subunit